MTKAERLRSRIEGAQTVIGQAEAVIEALGEPKRAPATPDGEGTGNDLRRIRARINRFHSATSHVPEAAPDTLLGIVERRRARAERLQANARAIGADARYRWAGWARRVREGMESLIAENRAVVDEAEAELEALEPKPAGNGNAKTTDTTPAE